MSVFVLHKLNQICSSSFLSLSFLCFLYSSSELVIDQQSKSTNCLAGQKDAEKCEKVVWRRRRRRSGEDQGGVGFGDYYDYDDGDDQYKCDGGDDIDFKVVIIKVNDGG